MSRIVATVDVQNVAEPHVSKKLDALIDTGASYLTLPRAWKEQCGPTLKRYSTRVRS